MPNIQSLYKSLLCDTLSNTLDRSKYTTSVGILLSIEFIMFE